MSASMSFAARLRELEVRMAAQAAADGHDYMACPAPSAPVDAVLIAMEPSLRFTRKDASAGNFLTSLEDFVLHHCVRRALVPGGTYHITDFSKGAMPVKRANVGRDARYARWAELLREELALVAKPQAIIVA